MEKKQVLIIGANGKIGRLTSEKLAKSEEFDPIAGIRKEAQANYFADKGIKYRMIDLQDSVAKLQESMDAVDSVVFTAGSGGHTGFDKTLEIDLDGAVKSMEAAKNAGVKRFVMVSAIHADNREAWGSSGIKPYYIAKHFADRALKASGLSYTILRPAALLDGKGTGKIATQVEGQSDRQIFREDVAEVIIAALSDDRTVGKVIDLINGEQSIPEALASLS